MNNPPITGFPELDSYLFNLSLGLLENVSASNTLSVRSDNAIVDTNDNVISYVNQYMHIKYADDNIGTNISDSPTNKAYFGLFNSTTGTESTTPADYTWYLVSGGFSTTKYLWYVIPGGRIFSYYIGTSAPSYLYSVDSGTAINLDIISSADGSSARVCYAKSSSSSLASSPTSVTVAGNTTFPATNTWGGSEVWVATGPALAANEYLYQSDGIYNPSTGFTTWNVPYLSTLKVGQLSAISANLGTITAGTIGAVTINSSTLNSSTINTTEISAGSSPAISGTSMTGSGLRLYNDGRIIMGNSSSNVVWDNSNLNIKGNLQSNNYSSGSTGWRILNDGSAEFNGVVLSRQLQIDSGAGYIGSNYIVANTDELLERSHFFIETNTAASAWSGTTKTMVALLSGAGSVSANAGDVSSQPQNIQWGFHADVAPITRWSGSAKIWIKCNVDTRLINFLVGGFTTSCNKNITSYLTKSRRTLYWRRCLCLS